MQHTHESPYFTIHSTQTQNTSHHKLHSPYMMLNTKHTQHTANHSLSRLTIVSNKHYTIYAVSRKIVTPSIYIWPAQITQSYGNECPANTVDCLTLQILLIKTYNRRFAANPTKKNTRQWSNELREAIRKKICLCLDFFQTAWTPTPPLYFWNASSNFFKTLFYIN